MAAAGFLRHPVLLGEECRPAPGHGGGCGPHRDLHPHGRVPGSGLLGPARSDGPAALGRADPRSAPLRAGPPPAVSPWPPSGTSSTGRSGHRRAAPGCRASRVGSAVGVDPDPARLVHRGLHRADLLHRVVDHRARSVDLPDQVRQGRRHRPRVDESLQRGAPRGPGPAGPDHLSGLHGHRLRDSRGLCPGVPLGAQPDQGDTWGPGSRTPCPGPS
jgi:hypothetical protein